MQDKPAGQQEEPVPPMPEQDYVAAVRRILKAGRMPEDQVPRCVQNSRKRNREAKK